MAEIKYPELKESTMSAELDAEQAAAEKRMREQERKARHDRDMAIFGDIANLFAQGAALHAGGKNVGRMQPATEVANERLRRLQESNSKQIAEYARQQIAARENKRKEDNAAMLARYNAELEADKYNKEQERKDRQEERQAAESDARIKKEEAYADYYNSGGKKTSGGGSSVNRDVYLMNDDGTKKVFKYADSPNNIRDAYVWLYTNYPEYAVTRNELVYEEDRRGVKVPKLDAKGNKVYEPVIDKYPTEQEMKQKFAEFNARELKKDGTVAPAKKANPMGSVKKANPMN